MRRTMALGAGGRRRAGDTGLALSGGRTMKAVKIVLGLLAGLYGVLQAVQLVVLLVEPAGGAARGSAAAASAGLMCAAAAVSVLLLRSALRPPRPK